jgi:hypothetical protein
MKGRKGVASRIAAAIGAVVASRLTAVFTSPLASAVVSRLSTGKRVVWVVALAVAIPLGAFGYQAQHAWRVATGGAGYGGEDFASFSTWKRGVEQTLKDAKAREEARPQGAAKAQDSIDKTKAPGKEAGEARLDLGVYREIVRKRAETVSLAGTKAASAAGAAPDAKAANDAKPATETDEAAPFSDSPLVADAREEQAGGASRLDGRNRRTETQRGTNGRDAEVAREAALARHALTYSWVTTDRAGHRWMHIRPLR